MKINLKTIIFVLTVCWSFSLLAQDPARSSNAQLVLTVVDAKSQRKISGAKILVQSLISGIKIDGKTANGEFAVQLDRGQYSATVSHPDFQSMEIPRLVIQTNKANVFSVELTEKTSDVEVVQVFADQSKIQSIGSAGTRYLDRESLRSATGSGGDILRALDGLAGLFSSGEFASFTVRGNGPRDNLIFVDGFPFQNIVHFSDGFGEQEEIEGGGRYSVFAPNIINGAEFQPGGWTAAYGGKAGSLLKLDVAAGNNKQASYTGLFDFAGFEVGYEGPNPTVENGSMLFSLRAQDFGRLFDIIGVDDIGSPKNTDLVFKTRTELDNNNSLETLIVFAPEENTRDLDNALASDEDDPGNYEDLELSDSEADNVLLGVTLNTLTGDTGVWEHRLYYRLFDETSVFGEAYPDLVPADTAPENIPVREGILRSTGRETEIGFRSDYSYINEFGKFTTGLRLAYVDLDYTLNLNGDWIQYQYDSADAPLDPSQHFVVLTPEQISTSYQESALISAAFAEQNFDDGDVSYRVGVRIENDGFASQTEFLPRLGAEWSVSSAMNVSATLGRYTQSVRYSDRASDPINSDLQNELVDTLSIGMTYQLTDNWQLLFEPYYQRLSNLLVETNGLSNTFNNEGEGRSYGFDTGLFKRFKNGWSLDVQYSFNNSEVKDASDLEYYDSDFNRPHFVTVGGLWDINQNWSISARFKFASGTPTDGFVIHEDVLGIIPAFANFQALRFSKENISTNTERFKNFNSLNFRVDYRTVYRGAAINVFFDVINAYGADNPSTTEFNERTGEDVIEEGEVFPFLGVRATF